MSRARLDLFAKQLIDGDALLPTFFTYTGLWRYRMIAIGLQRYRLITLLTNGVITFDNPYAADIWLCGGGGRGGLAWSTGQNSTLSSSGGGGAGGFFNSQYGLTLSGSYTAAIGPGGNASAPNGGRTDFQGLFANGGNAPPVGSIQAPPYGRGGNGGSGGGAGAYGTYNAAGNGGVAGTPGTGGGKSTVPFDDTFNFLSLCAGGAGGMMTAFLWSSGSGGMTATAWAGGGDGGSNGGDGKRAPAGNVGPMSNWNAPTFGGLSGGGNAAAFPSGPTAPAGFGNATDFGGGGAGAAVAAGGSLAGDGFPGVVFIRIPV